MELLDVFTDIETPPTSEDEDPEAPIMYPPRTAHISQLLLNMLSVVFNLTRETAYTELYDDRRYVKNVTKKLKRMKKNAKRTDFEAAYRHEGFIQHLNRIRQTYTDDGGRTFLNHLVALECYLTTEYDYESETDDESEPEEPIKKLKFNDDDDDDQGGQINAV